MPITLAILVRSMASMFLTKGEALLDLSNT
jgi:hypothetical protein